MPNLSPLTSEVVPQDLVELALSLSLDELFARFRTALAAFSAHCFAVYAVDGATADLRFSCGVERALDVQDGSRIAMARHPDLLELLAGGQRFVAASTPLDDTMLCSPPRLDPSRMSAVFNMREKSTTLGFVMLFGALPKQLLEEPTVSALTHVVETFTRAYVNALSLDAAQRSHRRAIVRIEQLNNTRDILLLEDLQDIMRSVIHRVMAILECESVHIWLKSDDGWTIGTPGDDSSTRQGAHNADPDLLERALMTYTPLVVNALSGDLVVALHSDDLVLASSAIFPLATHRAAVGALVAVDATVSGDKVDAVRAVADMGAINDKTYLIKPISNSFQSFGFKTRANKEK